MDIHYKDTNRFSVTFKHTYKDGTEAEFSPDFVDNLEKWNENIHRQMIIMENIDLEITFQSEEEEAKCFMDGFDILSPGTLNEDPDTEKYYLKSGQAIALYKHSPDYYPYIPGIYCVSVVIQSKTYYSLVRVVSNKLTEDQIEKMREEVEEEIRGLALDSIRKQHIYRDTELVKIEPRLFMQFNILNEHFADISSIVSDLANKVRTSLKKEYILKPIDFPGHVDAESIKYRVKHPENANYIKSLNKRIDYDLPENRLIKFTLEKWVKILNEFSDTLKKNLQELNKYTDRNSSYTSASKVKQLIKELSEFQVRASQMKGALNILKASSWYQEVSLKPVSTIPLKMYADVRYRKILLIDRELYSEETKVEMHPYWNFHWKRTDQLYEIWGFIKILRALQTEHFKFKLSSDWLLSPYNKGDSELFVIPVIPKGTTVKLINGDLKVHLVYDGYIPQQQNQATLDNVPVYTTGSNNNPDIRMDCYLKDVFIGTILADMKYRKKNALQDTMKQLTSYADNIRSPFIYNKKKWSKIRPVHRVLVFYPEKWGDAEAELMDSRSISFIPLTPGTNTEILPQTFKKLIEEVLLDGEEEGI